MKIRIGDKVRFLNDSGGGEVVKFIHNKMVEIRTDDGWDIPCPLNELVVMPEDDDGEAYKPDEIESEPEKKSHHSEAIPVLEKAAGVSDILFLIVQDQKNGNFSGLQCYLVNDSGQVLDFIYYRVGIEKSKIGERDSLDPGTKILLDKMSLEDLSSFKGWHIQGLLSHPGQDFVSHVIDHFVPFQTRKFASPGAYQENDFLFEPAIQVPLLPDEKIMLAQSLENEDVIRIIKEKEFHNKQINTPKQFNSPRQDRPPRQVDLHINQLIDKVVGLSNSEILGIQMEAFHRELNQAIIDNERSVIFIHGIGNGSLKRELRDSLDKDYPQCEHEDASFREYGYGATMVRIRQNK